MRVGCIGLNRGVLTGVLFALLLPSFLCGQKYPIEDRITAVLADTANIACFSGGINHVRGPAFKLQDLVLTKEEQDSLYCLNSIYDPDTFPVEEKPEIPSNDFVPFYREFYCEGSQYIHFRNDSFCCLLLLKENMLVSIYFEDMVDSGKIGVEISFRGAFCEDYSVFYFALNKPGQPRSTLKYYDYNQGEKLKEGDIYGNQQDKLIRLVQALQLRDHILALMKRYKAIPPVPGSVTIDTLALKEHIDNAVCHIHESIRYGHEKLINEFDQPMVIKCTYEMTYRGAYWWKVDGFNINDKDLRDDLQFAFTNELTGSVSFKKPLICGLPECVTRVIIVRMRYGRITDIEL
jgi:hypothetical protein